MIVMALASRCFVRLQDRPCVQGKWQALVAIFIFSCLDDTTIIYLMMRLRSSSNITRPRCTLVASIIDTIILLSCFSALLHNGSYCHHQRRLVVTASAFVYPQQYYSSSSNNNRRILVRDSLRSFSPSRKTFLHSNVAAIAMIEAPPIARREDDRGTY